MFKVGDPVDILEWPSVAQRACRSCADLVLKGETRGVILDISASTILVRPDGHERNGVHGEAWWFAPSQLELVARADPHTFLGQLYSIYGVERK